MKISPVKAGSALAVCAMLALAGCSGSSPNSQSGSQQSEAKSYSTREVTDGKTTFIEVTNPNGGATLSYSADSGIELLEVEEDGYTYAFKNMDGSDELSPWEDWRLSAEERAKDLAPQLSVEQKAGLMLYGPHERGVGDGLTDDQKTYIQDGKLRNLLHAGSNNVKESVQWANEAQAFAESLATPDSKYIPLSFSSDPRSDARDSYTGAEGGDISQWPGNLGLAATFDPAVVENFARITSEELRALGIQYALSPQLDVATEPRYARANGTFGEDSDMVAEMAKAYVEGYQNTYDEQGNPTGWGPDSVATVIKHFAGDAASEGGGGSHTNPGKYTVFPGNNFDAHLKPFVNAIDSLGAMTTYSIPLDGNGEPLFERIGAAYNKEMVDVLREDNQYEGIIVTDWNVLKSGSDENNPMGAWGQAWGAEDLSIEERFFTILKAGVDQFGGESDSAPLLAAHRLWDEAYANGDVDVSADERFTQSAIRVLTGFFKTGLYDNPYSDLEKSLAIAGSEEKIAAGFETQKDSVVLLKNTDTTISCQAENPWANKTVYIPRAFNTGHDGLFGPGTYTEGATLDLEVAESFFGTVLTDEVELNEDDQVVSYAAPDLADVDLVLVGFDNPDNGGIDTAPGQDPETGEYYPLSLQYRPYVADGPNVRKTSISGDLLDDGSKENRSYFGKTSRISNESNLDAFERAVAAAEATGKDIPVISVLKAKGATIPAEYEAKSDAIIVGFGVSDQALFEVASGVHEAKGRLPVTFPANMDTVEANKEDVAGDLEAYVDSEGNKYEFGFGLSCGGNTLQ